MFIIPSEMKVQLQRQIHTLQVPYKIVSQDKLNKIGKRELDQFENKCKKVLRRLLIRTGSIPFVHDSVPFFEEAPTMLCALKQCGGRLYMIATLDK